MTSNAHASQGSGPGVIAPDGCAVELYSLLPPGRDPEIIHGAVPPAASQPSRAHFTFSRNVMTTLRSFGPFSAAWEATVQAMTWK